jgi:proline iminopeptidase
MIRLLARIAKPLLYIIAAFAVIFLVSYLLTFGNYAIPKTVSDDLTLPRLTIGGALFHAETFGNPTNPIVIVVHGGPGWDYRSLLPLKALADAYFVVFYDQRGSGLSPRVDPKELTLESSLRDLDSFVDHFSKGKKVNLIGHSWGAMLVSAYLGRHPEKVGYAILAEPGFLTTGMMKESGVKFGPRWEAGFLYRASKAWFQSLHINRPDEDAASDYFLGEVAPYANPEYYCNGTIPEAGTLHWRAGAGAMQSILQSAIDAEGNFQINLIAGVEHFKSPILFIATECNSLIGKVHQEKQAMFFSNARIVVIKGSGHSMFGERPEESIGIVRDYFDKRGSTNIDQK